MSEQQPLPMKDQPRPGSTPHDHDPKDCWCWQKTARGTWRIRGLRDGEGGRARSLIVPGLDSKERRKRIRQIAKEVAAAAGKPLPDGVHNTQEMGLTDAKGRFVWNADLAEAVLAWTADGMSFKKLCKKLGCKALEFWRVLEVDEEFRLQYQKAFEYGLRASIDDIVDLLKDSDLSKEAVRQAAEIAKHLRWYGERMMPKVYGEHKFVEEKKTHEIGGTLANALLQAAEMRKALPPPAPVEVPVSQQVIDVIPEKTEVTFDE